MALKPALGAPLVGLCLWLGLALPASRDWLEAAMLTHMLVQLPLLGLCGWLIGRACGQARPWAAEHRLTLVIISVAAASWWMLPRWLDAAIADPLVEAAKFLSLPLLAGLPLALAWPRLGAIGKGLVLTNAISMLATAGWLYSAAPLRLCARYRLDQQQLAGTGMLVASLVCTVLVLAAVLRGGSRWSNPAMTNQYEDDLPETLKTGF